MEYFTKRTWAEIDLDHLEHNLRIVQSHLGQSKVMATVKADAYGHCEAIKMCIRDRS